MFDKVSQLAEQAATIASRRQFLGRFGRGAMSMAAVAGGLLALPTIAQGGSLAAACGPSSWLACVGKKPGDRCNVSRHVGVCIGPPNCACRFTRPPRGGR